MTPSPGTSLKYEKPGENREVVFAKGQEIRDQKSNGIYIVTSTTKQEVAYKGPIKKTAKIITIPATVYKYGFTYKVTSISANAFKNNKKVQTITIGTNIKKISKDAFKGCQNLKALKILTTKLSKSTIAGNVFKPITNKTKIKVPRTKKKYYQSVFEKRGLSKKIKLGFNN